MVDPLTLLRNLVAIPSISGKEEKASAYLVSQMNQLGYKAHIDEVGNAVGLREQPNDEGHTTREIMLLGHIDTVPGNIPVHITSGKLYGRGAVDAKGSLATFVMSGSQAYLSPGTRLVVVGAVEEEAATSKGAAHIVDRFMPDFCIIGEPSNWDAVTLGYKGRMLFDYQREQFVSHSAGPERTIAEYAVDWWNTIRDYATAFNDGREGLFNHLLPSLRHIETHSEGLTDRVIAKVGIRLPPDLDMQAFAESVRRYDDNADIEMYGYVPAYRTSRSSVLVRTFSTALRRQGIRPRLKIKTGTSDMNIVGPAWSCPMVAYGPGDSRLDHTPNEHLLVEDYLWSIHILTNVLELL